jgi:hypothetical protein
MRKHGFLTISTMALAIASAGCGNSDGLYEVYGKVLYKGEPAKGATVYFHRSGRPEPGREVIPMGIVQEDGTFRLVSDDAYGAPPGQYNVLIEWRDQPTSSKAGAKVRPAILEKGRGKTARASLKYTPSRVGPPDRLKGRYFDIEHPLVKAEVKPETQDLSPFELTD